MTIWTANAIQRMFALKSERKSSREIGLELGCSKNAVLGKLYRIAVKAGVKPPRKYPNSPYKSGPRTQPKGNPASPSPTPIEAAAVIAPAPKITRKRKPVGILQVTGCKWPLEAVPGLIGTHSFCNAKTDTGHSYCAEHAKENRAPYSRDLIRSTMRQVNWSIRTGRAA